MAITDAATYCATLVDEWCRAGTTTAFVAPGSRSTPVALALAADDRIDLHLFHDERAASFAALGHGLAERRPAILLCTSGTAAAQFHAAVVEADLSSVPMLVVTADRPPELWDIGAPQTIGQTHLYGDAVRFFAEPGVPTATASASWRSLAARAVVEANGFSGRPGPVHLNLSFRDPLVGEPGELPPGRPGGAPWHRSPTTEVAATGAPVSAAALDLVPTLLDGDRARAGVIIAGAGTPDPDGVLQLAERLGWPVLADHRSNCRRGPAAVLHFDALLRSDVFADRVRPEVVVRFGEGLASKVLGQWLGRTEAPLVSVLDRSRWSDPERRATTVLTDGPAVVATLLDALPTALAPATTGATWIAADRLAATAVEATLADEVAVAEIDVARHALTTLPSGGALVVSSSMPVRDVEWFGPARDDIEVFANRGANGIDGVVSTAIGVAARGRPTAVLIGDVALLHDSTALIALAGRRIDLHLIVIDNDGGGIFSFLPQAERLAPATYELLFGTPHGTDLRALAAAHGLPVADWPIESGSDGDRASGPRLTIATTDRRANVDVHDRVNRAVIKAIEA